MTGLSKFKGGSVSDFGIPMPFVNRPKNICYVDCFQGPNMFFKTHLLKKYGKIPWLYELYSKKQGRGEDVALSGTIHMSGYNLLLVPDIFAYHHHTNGGTAISSSGINRAIADSFARYKTAKIFIRHWDFLIILKFLGGFYLVTFY